MNLNFLQRFVSSPIGKYYKLKENPVCEPNMILEKYYKKNGKNLTDSTLKVKFNYFFEDSL